MDYTAWNSSGKNIGVGSLSLLQGIFLTQGSNPGLPRCGHILYQLSHKGSPTIFEWVTYPFSSRSSWPRNRTGVSCTAGGFFTNWVIREAHSLCIALALLIHLRHFFPKVHHIHFFLTLWGEKKAKIHVIQCGRWISSPAPTTKSQHMRAAGCSFIL